MGRSETDNCAGGKAGGRSLRRLMFEHLNAKCNLQLWGKSLNSLCNIQGWWDSWGKKSVPAAVVCREPFKLLTVPGVPFLLPIYVFTLVILQAPPSDGFSHTINASTLLINDSFAPYCLSVPVFFQPSHNFITGLICSMKSSFLALLCVLFKLSSLPHVLGHWRTPISHGWLSVSKLFPMFYLIFCSCSLHWGLLRPFFFPSVFWLFSFPSSILTVLPYKRILYADHERFLQMCLVYFPLPHCCCQWPALTNLAFSAEPLW